MTSVEVDGRTARREANRIAVLDAVIELFTEGNFDPSAEDVARRSGVSLRSVYRYVADKDDLSRAAIARHIERVQHLYALPDIGGGTFDDRLDRFVTARLKLYEAIAPTHRAARLRANTNEVIRSQLQRGRRELRLQVEEHFAPELAAMPARDRRNAVAAADALTQIETLDHLRVHAELSARLTRDVLRDALRRLLTPEEDT
jgi:AcrR family transcriptional regulator